MNDRLEIASRIAAAIMASPIFDPQSLHENIAESSLQIADELIKQEKESRPEDEGVPY